MSAELALLNQLYVESKERDGIGSLHYIDVEAGSNISVNNHISIGADGKAYPNTNIGTALESTLASPNVNVTKGSRNFLKISSTVFVVAGINGVRSYLYNPTTKIYTAVSSIFPYSNWSSYNFRVMLFDSANGRLVFFHRTASSVIYSTYSINTTTGVISTSQNTYGSGAAYNGTNEYLGYQFNGSTCYIYVKGTVTSSSGSNTYPDQYIGVYSFSPSSSGGGITPSAISPYEFSSDGDPVLANIQGSLYLLSKSKNRYYTFSAPTTLNTVQTNLYTQTFYFPGYQRAFNETEEDSVGIGIDGNLRFGMNATKNGVSFFTFDTSTNEYKQYDNSINTTLLINVVWVKVNASTYYAYEPSALHAVYEIVLDDAKNSYTLNRRHSYMSATAYTRTASPHGSFIYINADNEINIAFSATDNSGNFTHVNFDNAFSANSNLPTTLIAANTVLAGETVKGVGKNAAFALAGVAPGKVLGNKYITTTSGFAVEIR